ncbi:MAG: extracellular solute-binding protein, partial [Bacteroidales bacterium]|nr:extracellular solute-binding protein [Bacteroidales bacterium]
IEKGHEDYDVVCPSDYIIERMLQNDLLLPLDLHFGDTPNYVSENVSPFIRGYFDKIDGKGKNANDYAVGYMWGTTGILYNAKYVTDEEASTWEVLRNPKFADRIFIKDSPRDVASQLIIHLKQQELAEGSVTLDDLMLDASDETLAEVEAFLKDARQYIAGWEADFGKEQMIKERGWVNLNWSGDAQWAIVEGKESGVDLRFTCPKEGFTIFFDGWVIPKYAKNIKAANYWIDFLCRSDVAISNSEETGYVSCCGGQEMLEHFTDDSFPPLDASYFFGAGADSVCLDPVLYPDAADIARSTMEHDWGNDTEKLIAMWSRVKGSEANAGTIIVIAAVVLLAVFLVLRRRAAARGRARRGTRR